MEILVIGWLSIAALIGFNEMEDTKVDEHLREKERREYIINCTSLGNLPSDCYKWSQLK